jgi:V/A-type H+-transporting ATPase subunit A
MLDTSLAHRRHFPAINWFQSYSLYAKDVSGHYQQKVSSEWGDLLRWCRQILQEEESLREVAEIVGAEGLQDADRLLMRTAEMIRTGFLQQNAYSEDAFSLPEKTAAMMKGIFDFYDRAAEKLKQGIALDEAVKRAGAGSQ